MLGRIKLDQCWHWNAYGKHPVAKDYFGLGQDSSLSKSFSDWVEQGYEELGLKKDSDHEPVAWRFWARGTGKDSMACGLVKDSSDNVGRPYPLLIIGSGPLNAWDNHWDLLPFACEKTWGQTEYLSAHMFNDFQVLEKEIQNIRPPFEKWAEFNTKRKVIIESVTSSDDEKKTQSLTDMENMVSDWSEKKEGHIGLDQEPDNDQFSLTVFLHYLMKERIKAIPNVIFMGGTVNKSYIYFYNRPLSLGDFVQLWSISV